MKYFLLKDVRSNFETTLNLDGIDYVFLFHWNGRTNNWYYRMSLTDGTRVQGDKKLTSNTRGNKDTNENTPPGYLISYMPPGQGDPGFLDINTNFVWVYLEEEDI